MGFLIKNITNFLDVNNKYYNTDLKIRGKLIKPNQEIYFDINGIDFSIKKLERLKYISYKKVFNYVDTNIEGIYNQDILENITVIIPTYNNTSYIDECIESIKNSKIKGFNINIIIGIDNCENTKNHIKDNVLYSDVEVYYFNKNVGPYIVKNTLISLSKTENILFFDSDDIIENNGIQYINHFLNKGINFINFKYKDFGKTIHNTSNFAEGVIGIKKNIFLKLNGYYGWKCAADSEFRERYESKHGKTFRINTVLFNRRIHETNLTKREDTGMKSDIRNTYKNMMIDFRKNNYPNPDNLQIEEDYYKLF
jgi:glycosyltransferase involved in cell wall biosynthesis